LNMASRYAQPSVLAVGDMGIGQQGMFVIGGLRGLADAWRRWDETLEPGLTGQMTTT
jgi:hypothetical protein